MTVSIYIPRPDLFSVKEREGFGASLREMAPYVPSLFSSHEEKMLQPSSSSTHFVSYEYIKEKLLKSSKVISLRYFAPDDVLSYWIFPL